MSTIIFTAGAKGGTGKSTAARFLVTYLREHGADPQLLDLDDENRTLSRFFPEALQVEIKKRSSHDILVERALSGSLLDGARNRFIVGFVELEGTQQARQLDIVRADPGLVQVAKEFGPMLIGEINEEILEQRLLDLCSLHVVLCGFKRSRMGPSWS